MTPSCATASSRARRRSCKSPSRRTRSRKRCAKYSTRSRLNGNVVFSQHDGEIDLGRVDHAADAERPRGLDVLYLVVEEQNLARRAARGLDADAEERRVRLADAGGVGEHHRVEAREDVG